MKKLLYIIPCMVIMLTSCDWFVLDNQSDYDASIYGSIFDSGTGALVPNELPTNYSSITVYELGWDAEVAQSWNMKPNGTYRNNLIFSGDYKFYPVLSNYYPEEQNFTVVPGENKIDFTVTPYARIVNPEFSYDAANERIVATFSVEHGDPTRTSRIDTRLCVFPDRFVGQQFNSCKNVPGSAANNVVADGTTRITVYVDTNSPLAENDQFKYTRTHYIRVAAVATGPGVNTSRRANFSQVYALSSDFSTITEVTDW